MNIFDPKYKLSWRDYVRIFFRRFWLFILPFIIIMGLGIYAAFSRTPVFESTCTIQIKPNKMVNPLRRAVPQDMDKEYKRFVSLKNRIMSSDFLEQLIDTLDLRSHPRINEEADQLTEKMPNKTRDEIVEMLLLNKLKQDIKVTTPGVDILYIRAQAREPRLAYDMVNVLKDMFTQSFIEGEYENVRELQAFNEQQIETYKIKLQEAEQKLEAHQKNLLTSRNQQSLSAAALREIQGAITALDATIRDKEKSLDGFKRTVGWNGQSDDYPKTAIVLAIMNEIDQESRQMATLMRTNSWKSGEVIGVNRTINELRGNAVREFMAFYDNPASGVGGNKQAHIDKAAIALDYDISLRKRVALQNIIQNSSVTTANTPFRTATLTKLENEVALKRRIYNAFLEQVQGTQLAEAIQRANAANRFQLLEAPREPVKPMSTGQNMTLMLSFVGSLTLGLGAIYVGELMDSSVRNVEELEDLYDLPVIGVVPRVSNELDFKSENVYSEDV